MDRGRCGRAASVAALLLVLVGLAACSGDVTVGEGVDTDIGADASSFPRLGERTEPTPTEVATTPPPVATTEAVVGTDAPTQAPPPPTAAPEPTDDGPPVAIDVSINGDQSGTSQFDPSAARIYAETCVRFINADVEPRSVIADDGAFDSGLLDPGAEWILCPAETRRFNYHDGTRPYAVAYLEVVPR